MKFTLNTVFLGLKANPLRDGSLYYTANFFNTDTQTTISFNCGQNSPVAEVMMTMEFGKPCVATVELIPDKEKRTLYKLVLRSVV